MATLFGHATGNGRHRQGEPKATIGLLYSENRRAKLSLGEEEVNMS